MSLLADERAAISGRPNNGSVPVYTLSALERIRLEALTFTLTAGAAGHTHFAVVNYLDQSGLILSSIQDFNDVADSTTVFYTFGIGLVPNCGTALDGVTIQNALPDTVLENSSSVQVFTVDETGAGINGDAIGDVVLWGARDTGATAADVIPLLTPLAIGDQVGGPVGGGG